MFRIPVNESLFYYIGKPQKLCNATRIQYFCQCVMENNSVIQFCDFEGASDRPKYKQGRDTWKTLKFPGQFFFQFNYSNQQNKCH